MSRSFLSQDRFLTLPFGVLAQGLRRTRQRWATMREMAPDESDRDVLKSLPRTRPQRRSSKRDGAAKKASAAAKPKAATATKAKSAAKPRAKAGSAAPTSIANKRKRSGTRPR